MKEKGRAKIIKKKVEKQSYAQDFACKNFNGTGKQLHMKDFLVNTCYKQLGTEQEYYVEEKKTKSSYNWGETCF